MTAEFEQCRATARPQNKNRPAGGASHMPNPTDTHEPLTPTGQRGLIVAPPSGNTSEPDDREMRVLHKGFDTLAIAIRANIPSELFEYLETEKERADKERQDVLIEYNGVQLHLKAHGGNGYRFVASGGPFGANWFFKKPNSRDPWGIRVSFGSTFMANLGLASARLHLDGVLAKFGIRHGEDDVSISRVDFCIDVLAPDFALIPENFVMHSSANRRDFVTAPEKTVHGKSGRITSVTIGSPRNRQVIVYDKRAEIMKRGKDHWWRVWNDTLERQGIPPLDPKNPRNRVWRAEFRAGKDLLKDGWNIRTWAQLYERFGDLCRHSGEVVRYTDPSPTDPNRARWQNHLLWETVCAEMNADLCEMRSGCDPNPLKEVEREKHISLIFRGILGNCITLAALKDMDIDTLPGFLTATAKELSNTVIQDAHRTAKQLEEAKNRYVFLNHNQKRSKKTAGDGRSS